MLISSRRLRIASAWLISGCVSISIHADERKAFESSYFGSHVHRSVQNNLWKEVGFGTLRLHDANVTWAELEPERGVWKWSRLDSIVKNARAEGIDIVLPLQATPRWASSAPAVAGAYGLGANSPPADLEAWHNYAFVVASRYKGVISAYEIWNEPNLKKFFDGSPATLSKLTEVAAGAIRKADPNAKIVCSASTGNSGVPWLRAYLSAGAAAHCDVIAHHFYTGHMAPETMLPTISAVRDVMQSLGVGEKPLWNTESGWLISLGSEVDITAAGFPKSARVITEDEATAYIPRALLLAKHSGVSRFYWYSWDHQSMGISLGRGTGWTRPGRLYKSFVRLVKGASIEGCRTRLSGWSCTLKYPDGTRLWASWSEAGSFQVPSPFSGRLQSTLSSGEIQETSSVREGQLVSVGFEPVFVRENHGQ